MAMPVIGSLAQRVYDALEPMAYDEAMQGYALAIFVGAIGDVLFQEIDDYASDTDDGKVGWSLMLDIDRAPDKALPWLSQFVGVVLTGGLDPADQRQQIRDLANWKRGTPQALHDAPKPYLTGNQTVVFRERDGGPYKLTVITYTPETPDPITALAAILAQKPAGITLSYRVNAGQDYMSVRTNYATYDAINTAYGNYTDLLIDEPGT